MAKLNLLLGQKRENSKPLIKICGLKTPSEAFFCAQAGADLVGFIFYPPSPRNVAPAAVREFATPGALRVGVFVDQKPSEILAIIREARLDLAQFHGPQDLKVAEMVGPERVIRVFWPERLTLKELAADLDKWREAAALYLFDAGRSLGGHGQKLTNLNFGSPKAYLLAGGLSPPDLGRLWPGSEPNFSGFDFNSGLESAPGVKDQAAIASLFQVRAAYSQGLDGSVATRG